MSTAAIWASDAPGVTQNGYFGEDTVVNAELDSSEFCGSGLPRIVGKSASLQSVLGMVRIVAPTDSRPVCIPVSPEATLETAKRVLTWSSVARTPSLLATRIRRRLSP